MLTFVEVGVMQMAAAAAAVWEKYVHVAVVDRVCYDSLVAETEVEGTLLVMGLLVIVPSLD